MKIAVVYNRQSEKVINLFGQPNREKYGLKAIQRIVNGLKKYDHQVISLEADKDLIHKLEEFMPRVLKGERPGMVFNLSYGIQGQARYTHVPGILEMMGIPYVGSGPLAHSLALDKVVAKMIFVQNNIPTPAFAVLNTPDFSLPDLPYPLIVKPKNEAVSMGIEIVNNDKELRKAAQVIFETFDNQPVLVEQYIKGREVNVGLLGNNPPEVLPPCEIVFGKTGPQIYTLEDKKGKSGREIKWRCPAPIGDDLIAKAQEIAKNAFSALGCYDCARVDMRMDEKGYFYVLEINSLPSLGEHGSYVIAAQHVGLDFPALVNRLVEAASARYFGTPSPPSINVREKDPEKLLFSFLTQRRDRMEKRLEEWVSTSSRTGDPMGNKMAISKLDTRLTKMKMVPVSEFTDKRSSWMWETKRGFENGTLFIGHIDVPLEQNVPFQFFRRDPEWLYGEGIGMSRAPLVMMEFALRALRYNRMLHQLPIGILYYLDEGRDCRYSEELIRCAAEKASRVFVLRPGGPPDNIRVQRRGHRKYHLTVEGIPRRLGKYGKAPETLLWLNEKIFKLAELSSRKERLTVTVVNVKTESFRMSSPHQIITTLVVSYLDPKAADVVEEEIKKIFGKNGFKWSLEQISDRPPMKERRTNVKLSKSLLAVADRWEIPIEQESSLLPSVGGLVPSKVPVVCGIGPVARDLYTPHESVNRISFMQRTLLIAELLAQDIKVSKGKKNEKKE
jgi:D-alanine-D-alanine ligase